MLGTGRYQELLDWCSKHSITIRGCQGSGLDGNNSKNFFKAIKDLHLLLGKETAAPIANFLQKFDEVTKACFSHNLEPGWRNILDRFITSVWELVSFCKFTLGINLSIPWKIHILVAHLRPFLEKTGEGLADYSEQTGEAGHHKAEVEMKRFKRDINNPNHGKQMLAGCGRFNSKRW